MNRVLVIALVVLVSACGGDSGEETGDEPAPGQTTTTVEDTSTSEDSPPATDETLPVATTTIAGTVVGGSGGGEGEDETDSFSEVVRDSDGSCAGWAGRAGDGWTSGVRDGAEIQLFDVADGGSPIASGTVRAGQSVNVDPPNEQWQCELSFSVEDVPVAEEYWAEVGGLARVQARPGPGGLVVPMSTVADASLVSSCADQESSDEVGEWSSVGQYWSQGLPSVCSAGLRVADLDRVCRPPSIASDRVVAVLAEDGTVLEDAGGLQVDPSELPPGTAVIVQLSTAYPC